MTNMQLFFPLKLVASVSSTKAGGAELYSQVCNVVV